MYAKYSGHMIKMAAMSVYGKNPLKIDFSEREGRWPWDLVCIHWGCRAYLVFSNDDPRLTLTYLTARSNLLPNAFKWENFWKADFFF